MLLRCAHRRIPESSLSPGFICGLRLHDALLRFYNARTSHVELDVMDHIVDQFVLFRDRSLILHRFFRVSPAFNKFMF